MSLLNAPGVRAAVGWTLAQHGAFFVSAWLVSWWAGAVRFGEWSQALALATVLSTLVTLRLEYAGQLEARLPAAMRCFAVARGVAWWFGGGAAALGLGAAGGGLAPWWLAAGGLAVAPLALVQVAAAQQARAGRVACAAALRALPALWMVLLQIGACAGDWPQAVAWSLPVAAWLGWGAARPGTGPAQAARPLRRASRVLAARWAFVRAEWLALALNTSANHGQVLLVGALAGDAAAGVMALGLRVAMLPTSLVGPAWADSLRARVVAQRSRASALVQAALRRMAGLSAGLHLAGGFVAWLALPWVFPAHGGELLAVVLLLLPLGAVRLVASPVAFTLAWRGWLGLSLLGQGLLFGAALGAAAVGIRLAGVAGVAAVYAATAACVYAGYIVCALRAVRADTSDDGTGELSN